MTQQTQQFTHAEAAKILAEYVLANNQGAVEKKVAPEGFHVTKTGLIRPDKAEGEKKTMSDDQKARLANGKLIKQLEKDITEDKRAEIVAKIEANNLKIVLKENEVSKYVIKATDAKASEPKPKVEAVKVEPKVEAKAEAIVPVAEVKVEELKAVAKGPVKRQVPKKI